VAFTASTEAELAGALAAAKRETRTCVIWVPVEPRTPLPGFSWWDVAVAQVSPAPGAAPAQQAYAEGLKKRRLYY
jgi:3D-(3,5/4)-trihydroxycyclohexane-1,2-dione acylhydrolase (decyclizing)